MFYLNHDTPSHPGGPSPTLPGWFYIAYDYCRLGQTKVGITSRPVFERIKESKTSNPYYVLFAAFHVPDKSLLLKIEKYFFWKLHLPIVNHISENESEWLIESPSNVFGMILGKIPNVLEIDCDCGDYDFTRTIYLPQVNPYGVDLNLTREQLEEYVRFAAPDMYLEELKAGHRRWDARPDFINEAAAWNQQRLLPIVAPQVLLDRFNYDLALRGLPPDKQFRPGIKCESNKTLAKFKFLLNPDGFNTKLGDPFDINDPGNEPPSDEDQSYVDGWKGTFTAPPDSPALLETEEDGIEEIDDNGVHPDQERIDCDHAIALEAQEKAVMEVALGNFQEALKHLEEARQREAMWDDETPCYGPAVAFLKECIESSNVLAQDAATLFSLELGEFRTQANRIYKKSYTSGFFDELVCIVLDPLTAEETLQNYRPRSLADLPGIDPVESKAQPLRI